jgi:hypothetical protein
LVANLVQVAVECFESNEFLLQTDWVTVIKHGFKIPKCHR